MNDPFYNSPSWGPLRGKGGHCDVSHEEVGLKRLNAFLFFAVLFYPKQILISHNPF